MFSVVEDSRTPSILSFYKKYVNLRPPNMESNRFFIFYKDGKCRRQVVGKNFFGEIPKKIAAYLKLPNPELYTGHSFRRSSATFLANAGENIIGIKQIGGWKSTSVAEQYIEDSVANKQRLAGKIFSSVRQDQVQIVSSDSGRSTGASTSTAESTSTGQSLLDETANKLIPNIYLTNCTNCVVNINISKYLVSELSK